MSDQITTGYSAREFEKVRAESIRRKRRVLELESELTDLKTKNNELMTSVTNLTAERDGLQEKYTKAPNELQIENERLKGELRTRDHRSAFAKLAKDHIKADAVDAAWELAKWTADSDDVDEAKMGEAITSLVGKHAFLKIEPDGSQTSAGGTQTATIQTRTSGPGLTRGGATPTGPVDQRAEAISQLRQAVGHSNPLRIA